MRSIPQRELRNNISRVLREVQAGERLRVTVDGRPVADLVPIGNAPRTFVERESLMQLLKRTSLDVGFSRDVEGVAGTTIEEL